MIQLFERTRRPAASSIRVRSAALAAGLAVAAGQPASALHTGDIFLAIPDGVLTTGAVKAGGGWTLPVTIFTGQFGDSGFPGFTANPGFDCLAGTFTPGTRIGFNILEPLLVWNGDGFEATGGETMTISFLSLSVQTGVGFVPGFELAVQANGGFHRHYNMFLNGPGAAPPDPGVYLLVREMYSTDPAIEPSEPFHLLLGHLVSSAEIQAAADWLVQQGGGRSCPADLDGDGEVGGADLGLLLAAWDSGDPVADLDGSGVVDGADLGTLLAAWGVCGP